MILTTIAIIGCIAILYLMLHEHHVAHYLVLTGAIGLLSLLMISITSGIIFIALAIMIKIYWR